MVHWRIVKMDSDSSAADPFENESSVEIVPDSDESTGKARFKIIRCT